MNFIDQIPVRKTAEEKAQEKKDIENQKINSFLFEVFDFSSDPEERLGFFEDELQKFASFIDEEEINKVRENIRNFCEVQDKEDFVERGFLATKPLMDWKEADKVAIEVEKRKEFVKRSEFIPLNESLSYGKTGQTIHIHVAPSETLSAGTQLVLLRDGLRKLRKIVEEDETVEKITATSWIIATEQGKGIMEKLDFKVTGEISEEMREKFFKSETRPVSEAVMTRDEFLENKRYK